MSEWIKCSNRMPPQGFVVITRINDDRGIRNEQRLKLNAGLWFVPDGSMYVYYSPTEWRATP